jgi:DNA-binding beta-propeller fold protein YncE
MRTRIRLAAAVFALAAPASLAAQIAVSANDGKQTRPGEASSTRTHDSVSIIDMRSYPPRTIGTVEAPASMIGPPASVAVDRRGGFALVSAAQRLNAAGEIELNATLSVIDLANPAAPKLVQTVQAGPGASGVTINAAGTLALVASTGDDMISIFTIANKRLTPAGKIQLPAKARPTDVRFAPSGTMALIVAQGAGQLLRLAVSGNKVALAGAPIPTGVQPYGVAFSPDGRFSYNSNLGGRTPPAGTTPVRGPKIGTVSAVDLSTDAVVSVDVGYTPEHVTLSRDGKFMALVIANNSANAPDSPGYNPFGLLKVYSVAGTVMTPVAEAHSGAWCQGAIFSDDMRTIALQCAMSKDIEIFRFDGKSLVQDDKATLKFDARPGAIATPGRR